MWKRFFQLLDYLVSIMTGLACARIVAESAPMQFLFLKNHLLMFNMACAQLVQKGDAITLGIARSEQDDVYSI